MPIRIPLHSLTLGRGKTRIAVAAGEAFDFTAAEAAELDKAGAVRKPDAAEAPARRGPGRPAKAKDDVAEAEKAADEAAGGGGAAETDTDDENGGL